MSIVTGGSTLMRNYVDGEWVASSATDSLPVLNPATGEQLGTTPLSTATEVGQAVDAASRAFPAWRRTPVTDRVQFLFKLKALLERHFDEISRTITLECGKTLAESRGEMRRAIENVDVACGTPILIQGYNSEDIAAGIDEIMIRQPLGVCAIDRAVQFSRHDSVLVPSVCDRVRQHGRDQAVGARAADDAEGVRARGRDRPAARSAEPGERRQGRRERDCSIILQCGRSASWDRARSPGRSTPARRPPASARSARAARRIRWSSFPTPISGRPPTSSPTARSAAPASAASRRRSRLPWATRTSRFSTRFATGRSRASSDSASMRACRWGRSSRPRAARASSTRSIRRSPRGRVRWSTAENSTAQPISAAISSVRRSSTACRFESELTTTEIFGPVLSAHHVDTVDEAIALVNTGSYGNQACLFTTSGANARKFRHEAEVGNIGINIAVAAPMAFFPFSGARDSFFGDLHGQGRDAVEFFTQEKVVVERWPASWTRRF